MIVYTDYPANIDRLRAYRRWHTEQSAAATETAVAEFHTSRVAAIDERWDYHHANPYGSLNWWHPSFSVMEDETKAIRDLKIKLRTAASLVGNQLLAVEDTFDEIRAMREASFDEDEQGKRRRKPDVRGAEERPVPKPVAAPIEEDFAALRRRRARASIAPHMGVTA